MSNTFHPYTRGQRRVAPMEMQNNDPISMVKFKTPTIQPSEVHLEKSIGKGTFGEVFKGKCRGETVAIKILNKQQLSEKQKQDFEREVILISKYTHPNIVQFLGACFVPDRMMIVTEFIPRGDLEDMLADERIKLSFPTRMKMAKGAAKGMNWLHLSEHPFIHRDLKTKNLLVGENNIIKICDFGLSQVKMNPDTLLQDPRNGAKGTPIWMAPEILTNQKFNEKCDVYSFGLILWCLLTRDEPYTEYEDLETFRNDICRKHVRPPIPRDCLPSLKSLIEACWHRNPESRPTFEEIIEQLDYIIIDYSIFDVIGRKIWVENFFSLDKVTWSDFLYAFQNEIENHVALPVQGLTMEMITRASDCQLEILSAKSSRDIQNVVEQEFQRRYPGGKPRNILDDYNRRENQFSECLEVILATKTHEDGMSDDAYVSMERFGEILNWFGPIFGPQGNPVIYDNLLDTARQPWFHGDINQDVAEDRIRGNRSNGSFLVRFSSKPGFYTISQLTGNDIEHRRISHSIGEPFMFGRNVEAPSLPALIQRIAGPLGLLHPCPGSRFTRIFTNTAQGGYVQSGGYLRSSMDHF